MISQYWLLAMVTNGFIRIICELCMFPVCLDSHTSRERRGVCTPGSLPGPDIPARTQGKWFIHVVRY